MANALGTELAWYSPHQSITNDVSGNGHNWDTITPSYISAQFEGTSPNFEGGLCLATDGNTIYPIMPSSLNSSAFESGTFSVSLWFNAENFTGYVGSSYLLTWGNNDEWRVSFVGGSLTSASSIYFSDTNGNILNPSVSLSNGTWYHFTLTYDSVAGEVKMYLDGTLIDSDLSYTAPSPAPGIGKTCRVGASYYTAGGTSTTRQQTFHGWFDDIRVFSSVLGTSDITTLAGSRNSSTDVTSPTAPLIGRETALYAPALGSQTAGAVWDGTTQAVSPYGNLTQTVGGSTDMTVEANTEIGGSLAIRSETTSRGLETPLRRVELNAMRDHSFALWIKLDSLPAGGNYTIGYIEGANSQDYYRYEIDSVGRVVFKGFNGSSSFTAQSLNAADQLSTGTWYHLMFTHTASNEKIIHLDGVEIYNSTSGFWNGFVWDQLRYFGLGTNGSTTTPIDGLMDDVRFYTYYDASGDITTIYNSGSRGSGGGSNYVLDVQDVDVELHVSPGLVGVPQDPLDVQDVDAELHLSELSLSGLVTLAPNDVQLRSDTSYNAYVGINVLQVQDLDMDADHESVAVGTTTELDASDSVQVTPETDQPSATVKFTLDPQDAYAPIQYDAAFMNIFIGLDPEDVDARVEVQSGFVGSPYVLNPRNYDLPTQAPLTPLEISFSLDTEDVDATWYNNVIEADERRILLSQSAEMAAENNAVAVGAPPLSVQSVQIPAKVEQFNIQLAPLANFGQGFLADGGFLLKSN